MTVDMDISLYLHIPFCKKKCKYCDFVSINARDEFVASYVSALEKEIEMQGKAYDNAVVKTVFFGGGTPSLLPPEHFSRIMRAVKNNFKTNFSEVTVECNPESLTQEKLEVYKAEGVNRISIGVQSFDDNILRFLGRIHDKNTAIEAIKSAKLYFDNVSADLIIGVPGEQIPSVLHSVDLLNDLGVTHVSAYGLKVEPGTVLYELQNMGAFELNEDFTADVYDAVLRRLESHGYERYEISNFARDGYESRHNLAYWLRTPYLGLGAAAYSFVNGARFSNVADVSEYVRSVEQGVIPERNREVLTASDEKEETIMLSLRTKYGMNLNEYNEKFHADFLTEKAVALQKNAEFLIISNNNITINKDYFYISNAIISDLI